MSTSNRFDAVADVVLAIVVDKSLDHAVDVAIGLVCMVGRAVHGTSTASEVDPVFANAHRALQAVRLRLHEAAKARGGNALFVMRAEGLGGVPVSRGGRS